MNQIQLIEIVENSNVEVWAGSDLIHTASDFASAARWLETVRGTSVSSHNFSRLVLVPPNVLC